MRPLRDMQTIQIEVTNACVNSCSNCTRLCGHHRKPFFMSFDEFRQAVDSLAEFPHMVGVMGGEPLLHPEFERLCAYLRSRIPPARCGLWSVLPRGFERYARVIAETFWNVLLNDHTRPGIGHMPFLIRSRDVAPEELYWYAAHHCFYQNAWSASITPRGAYFCEVAASLDIILETGKGWPVEPGWWKRSPNHFVEQMEAFCPNCGGCLRAAARPDTEGIDDLSPWWQAKLEEKDSPKMKAGRYRLYKGPVFTDLSSLNGFRSDIAYSQRVAAKYGLTLAVQANGFLRPMLP